MQLIARQDKGFSLVELMIAMFIFMIAMLGILAGLNSAIANNKTNVLRDEAINVAEEEMNRLKDLPFASLAATAPNWTNPVSVVRNIRSGQINYNTSDRVTDITTDIKRIDVQVTWSDKGINYQHTISSIIVNDI
ncbi:MAG: type IV pilus modification PilV family protein [Dissulfurimicrobium sp.]|uniref:type IV pilus modification PilV family protein n=1 Tax=Dissulfurimicrobium TaxID=1769732 RepID=UPI001EDA37C0|nr:prepilin-type N-terminal cleavage/methylation domain-containing protein [Dissulfurimicrobium hydrothermale]UKL14288.1 prepilin-type N-terminal cleavage/methylation domain-containing protein [Dissulfurimicrobium hydrothermale]